jgi:hypothetical protein
MPVSPATLTPPTMSSLSRWFVIALLPLAACNIQISSPDGSYSNGDTRLPAPSGLTTIALDGAVHISWNGSVIAGYPGQFKHYRVYSTTYSVGAGRCNEGAWVLEGTTVSDAFLVANLQNGVPLCFAVSSVARDGGEGARGLAIVETPRYFTRVSM